MRLLTSILSSNEEERKESAMAIAIRGGWRRTKRWELDFNPCYPRNLRLFAGYVGICPRREASEWQGWHEVLLRIAAA
jgi:hypothetical protein